MLEKEPRNYQPGVQGNEAWCQYYKDGPERKGAYPMMWECTECRIREGTHIRPCQADTGVNSVPPAVCLLDPRGSNAKWRRIQLPSPKVSRRKLRSVSILCVDDLLSRGMMV